MRTRVLVVAQQTALRAAVARTILPMGYRVEVASNEKSARPLLRKEQFEAAIVAPVSTAPRDIGFLREVEEAVDKLVILAEDESTGKHFAGSFPDALICRAQPPEFEKLVPFVCSTVPKMNDGAATSVNAHVQFEGCTLDLAGHIFSDGDGREVMLTRGEFALLVAFVGSPGRVLSRAELRRAVTGGRTEAYDRSIDMLVARLRRKIERQSKKVQFIVTVPGVGYKFIARVRTVDAETTMPGSAASAQDKSRDSRTIERRQLTVLSCQILGFATLAAALDPEDLDKVIGHVYTACADIITRFGGTMVRGLGDIVLGYFGHPRAHENDAENAVRAALEMARNIPKIEHSPQRRFQVRIGVATSLMLVGESGAASGREPIAIGEALNLAQHLHKAASAGSVVIGVLTRELIGRRFDCCQLAPLLMEEGHEPTPVWQVIDENLGTPRFEALRRDGMLDLVGRGAEVERLTQLWRAACGGAGQVVWLNGEAGIGKSRLAIELEERLRGEPHATIRYSGSPHRSEAPMAALLDELQNAAGFVPADPVPQKLEKLGKLLGTLGTTAREATALLAGLLSLPYDASPELLQLSPQKRKERTFAALLRRIEAAAAKQATLLVMEDVHWVDPTSLEFFSQVVERAQSLRLLLLIIGRTEFVPPWPNHSYVTTLMLSRLSRTDSTVLIQQVAVDQRVPVSIEAEIVSRADGVPLFIEELTKSVLERSADGAPSASAQRPKATSVPHLIPSTLHGLLLARFDRLDRAKEIAQAAAVVGREFSFELLRLIAGVDDGTLVAALDELVSSGLVFRRGPLQHANFVFKHALVRDAAYDMLLRDRRQMLHGAVARSYEERYPETAATEPELLGHHWREAGESIRAVGYFLAAAERALLRSATTEALSHLTTARYLLSALAEDRERFELELKLEITLGRALIARRGYTAQETRESYVRARVLCDRLNDEHWLPLVLFGHSITAWFGADYPATIREAQELDAWGKRNHEAAGEAVAHLGLGMTFLVVGDLEAGRRHLEQALQINRFILPSRQPFLASDTDGRISSLSYLHDCLLLLGFPDQAQAAANEAALLKPDQLYSLALAQIHRLRMYTFARDSCRAAETGASVLRLCQEQGYPYFAAIGMVHTGWAMAQNGDIKDGIKLCQSGLVQLDAVGSRCWLPRYLGMLAECYAQAGDAERSAETLTKALACIAATGERVWEAEIYRLQSKLHFHCRHDASAAEASFVTALRKARQQKLKLLELRAATDLANLLMHQGAATAARELLTPIYSSFTEGFEFADLREAKHLLDSLPTNRATASKLRRTKRSRLARV